MRYEQELSRPLLVPGVAIGLAWTAVGGETMYVEACKMPGEGKLVLTGQLGEPLQHRSTAWCQVVLTGYVSITSSPTPIGDVMKESAQISLNWVRANAAKVGTATGTRLRMF